MARAAARSLDGGEGWRGSVTSSRYGDVLPHQLSCGRHPATAESRPAINLDDVLARFAAIADDSPEVRHVRGTALAVGMDWLIRLPDATDKQRQIKSRALEQLAGAADLACSVYELAD